MKVLLSLLFLRTEVFFPEMKITRGNVRKFQKYNKSLMITVIILDAYPRIKEFTANKETHLFPNLFWGCIFFILIKTFNAVLVSALDFLRLFPISIPSNWSEIKQKKKHSFSNLIKHMGLSHHSYFLWVSNLKLQFTNDKWRKKS